MIRIYVAGPITKPSPMSNALHAIDVADTLFELGYAPFVPQLSVFWQEHGRFKDDGKYSTMYEQWLKYDFCWLETCDALFRIPGFSLGADREVQHARDIGIPVFYSFTELRLYYKEKK